MFHINRLWCTQSLFEQVIYIAPLKAIVRERMNDWKKRLVSQLGKEMVNIPIYYPDWIFWHMVLTKMECFSQVEMTGDYTPDLMALLSADIIISTPEKWDGISRNWHSRNYVKKVHSSTPPSPSFPLEFLFFLSVLGILGTTWSFVCLKLTCFNSCNCSIGWPYDFGWDSLIGGWSWTHSRGIYLLNMLERD